MIHVGSLRPLQSESNLRDVSPEGFSSKARWQMVVADVRGWAGWLLEASIRTVVFCGLAVIGPGILPAETDGAAKARGAQPQPAKDSLGDALPEGAAPPGHAQVSPPVVRS